MPVIMYNTTGNAGDQVGHILLDLPQKLTKIELWGGTCEMYKRHIGLQAFGDTGHIVHRHIGSQVDNSSTSAFYDISQKKKAKFVVFSGGR